MEISSSRKTTPEKSEAAFRTIGEVSDELNVPQHVLRFWETKFTQVKPLKRGGGRRYYRPEDVALLRRIYHLLYTEGYTIRGVQKLMKGQGRLQAANDEAVSVPAPKEEAVATPVAVVQESQERTESQNELTDLQRSALQSVLDSLKDLRAQVSQTESA